MRQRTQTKMITLRISPNLHEYLVEMASRNEESLSNMIRYLLEQTAERHRNNSNAE